MPTLFYLRFSPCGTSTSSGHSEKLGLESPSVEEMPLPPSPADININHYYSQSFWGFHCYVTQNPCEMGRMHLFSFT